MWLAQSGRIGRLWRRSQFTTDEGSRDPAFAQAHARAGFSFLANEALGTTPCDLLIPAASSCGRLPCRLARRLISVHGIAPPRIVMQRRNHCSQKPSTTLQQDLPISDIGPARSWASAISPNGIYGISRDQTGLLCLDVGRPNNFSPLVGFFGDEFAELGGRTRKRWVHVGKPRLDLRVGKRGVDLSVKLANDLSRRVLRSAEAEPATKQRGAERLALALRPFPFLGCPHTRKGNQARS
jgi:hypothetical protein